MRPAMEAKLQVWWLRFPFLSRYPIEREGFTLHSNKESSVSDQPIDVCPPSAMPLAC